MGTREISGLIDDVANLQAIVDQTDTSRIILTPKEESLLVDGTIVSVDPTSDEVFLSIGRRDKVPLGITFTV